ncbi:MAG: M14 family zinc carboxypeptidase, partial [Planctomycetota bacterium]
MPLLEGGSMGTVERFAAICILSIAGCGHEYAGEEVRTQFPEGNEPVVRSMELGKSVEGRAIRMHVFGEVGPVVLFFGGMHGDEPASQHVALCLVDYLLLHDELYTRRRVAVIPTLNPDGIVRRTRVNASGVDINRNFPTQDWRRSNRTSKFYGGPKPSSEPETRALLRAVDVLKPLRIIAIHVAVGIPHCVEHDGPAAELAHAMAAHNGYPVQEEMGYPTPGSFGTWVGKERGIPEITLELRDHREGQKLWPEHRAALVEAIVFGLDGEEGRQRPKNDYPEAGDEEGWGEAVDGLRCRWIGPKGPVFVGDYPEISMEVENVSGERIFWECLEDSGLAVVEPGSGGLSVRMLRFKVRIKQGVREAAAHETQKHFGSTGPGHYCLEPGGRMALSSNYPGPLAKAGPTRIEGYLFRENPFQARDFPYPEGLILCP